MPPAHHLPQARKIVATVLPLRSWNRRQVLLIIRFHTPRNHQAYLSHRKKRLAALAFWK